MGPPRAAPLRPPRAPDATAPSPGRARRAGGPGKTAWCPSTSSSPSHGWRGVRKPSPRRLPRCARRMAPAPGRACSGKPLPSAAVYAGAEPASRERRDDGRVRRQGVPGDGRRARNRQGGVRDVRRAGRAGPSRGSRRAAPRRNTRRLPCACVRRGRQGRRGGARRGRAGAERAHRHPRQQRGRRDPRHAHHRPRPAGVGRRHRRQRDGRVQRDPRRPAADAARRMHRQPRLHLRPCGIADARRLLDDEGRHPGLHPQPRPRSRRGGHPRELGLARRHRDRADDPAVRHDGGRLRASRAPAPHGAPGAAGEHRRRDRLFGRARGRRTLAGRAPARRTSTSRRCWPAPTAR
mgnify:CR=1 FL=1